jgi:hypothetical protein
MLKINASFSKKIPAEVDYSSKSYMASIEVELPAGLSGQELREKIADTFSLVRDSVETEINARPDVMPGKAQKQTSTPQGKATNKQIKFILDLGKVKEKTLADLNAEAARLYAAETIYELSKPDASKFVDVLKAA